VIVKRWVSGFLPLQFPAKASDGVTLLMNIKALPMQPLMRHRSTIIERVGFCICSNITTTVQQLTNRIHRRFRPHTAASLFRSAAFPPDALPNRQSP
jgi:hypothetical protein